MKKKLITILMVAAMTGVMMAGCGKAEEAAPVEEAVVEEVAEEVAEEEVVEEEVAEEEVVVDEDGIADITSSMEGVWIDSVGDIYGFYADGSFEGYWVNEEQDVTGSYSLVTDGDNTCLSIQFTDAEEVISYYVTFENEVTLTLTGVEDGSVVELTPYVEE
jgi:hypothetical protein